mgnify:CR=1 FL=1
MASALATPPIDRRSSPPAAAALAGTSFPIDRELSDLRIDVTRPNSVREADLIRLGQELRVDYVVYVVVDDIYGDSVTLRVWVADVRGGRLDLDGRTFTGRDPHQDDAVMLAAADILPGQGFLDEYKRYFSQMDDKLKAQYCMLQAWVSYFQNDINTAFMNASRACKLDAANSDAWVTQVAMSILADKKPMLPKQPRPQRPRQGNPNNPNAMMGMEMETADPGQQSMQPGKLSFDLNALLIDAIGLKIEGLHLTCLNGTTFKYEPGQELLCALVWQEHAPRTISNEPNMPGRRRPQSAQPQPQPQPQMMEPMMMEPGMGGGFGGMDMFGGGFGGDPFTAANMAYSRLFQMGLPSGQVKFAAINLDAAEHKQKMIDNVVKHPWP